MSTAARPSRGEQLATHRSPSDRRSSRMRRQSRLYIDPRSIPHDVVYQWVRESVLGAHDPNNMSENLIAGWVPVRADRHPELVPPPFPGSKADELIRRGGLILCQRPKEHVEADLADLRAENEDAIASLDSEQTNLFHPSMPALKPERTTRVEVGIPRNKAAEGGDFQE